MTFAEMMARAAARDAADGQTLRHLAVSYRTLAEHLKAVTPQTDEGRDAVRDLIRQTNLIADDASFAADDADERAQAIIERNTA